MSIQNKGSLIRTARQNANLTQEQLAAGICSTNMLSQIENGTLSISNSFFDALLKRTGAANSTYPYYHSRCDFDCFYTLIKQGCRQNSTPLLFATASVAFLIFIMYFLRKTKKILKFYFCSVIQNHRSCHPTKHLMLFT